MAIHLYIAPTGSGKTDFCVRRVCELARAHPLSPVCAVLPNSAQARAFQRRVADAGGALGARAVPWGELCHELLLLAGQVPFALDDPLQHRLLRLVIDEAASAGALAFYGSLRDKPGFLRALHNVVRECGQARISPDALAAAAAGQGARLDELVHLYAAYHERLQREGWLDAEGVAEAALAALQHDPRLLSRWAGVIVDGADRLTGQQVALLSALAAQTDLTVTLTGDLARERTAHAHFAPALRRLCSCLGVTPEPLPGARVRLAPAIVHLEAALFEVGAPAVADPARATPSVSPGPITTAVEFVDAPNRAGEVRAALRWVKERLVLDGLAPQEVAVLARSIDEYAPFLTETAAEFGLPLYLAGGQPLAGNPAVAAILGLLRLVRNDMGGPTLTDGRFPRRQTVEALRSPYFDWQAVQVDGHPLDLHPDDVDVLDAVARDGLVLAGAGQWQEALRLAGQHAARNARGAEDDEEHEDGEPRPLTVEGVARLRELFDRLVRRLTPPGRDTFRGYTAFVEGLLGEDVLEGGPGAGDPAGLCVFARVRAGEGAIAARDIAALRRFNAALRGLVWAEATLGGGPVTYERFLDELSGVAAAGSYGAEECSPEAAVLAASATAARGLGFRAVALLGLSESQFPRPAGTEPLLRPDDRARLAGAGLAIEQGQPGLEFALFYEAVTRGRERLLLTRPYLTDAGQPWEPSPFWEEALRLSAGNNPVRRVRGADPLPLGRAASWPELVAALGQLRRARQQAAEMAENGLPDGAARLWRGALHGARILAARAGRPRLGAFDGDCRASAVELAAAYGPRCVWSASRLETYLTCPLFFFLKYTLRLEPPVRPEAGLEAAQLGSIWHKIFEDVVRAVPSGELERQLATLPAICARVLATAPEDFAFRPDALWEQQKADIASFAEATLTELADCSAGWHNLHTELGFGLPDTDRPAAELQAGDAGTFRLGGRIDRVDANGAGELRLIDYKSGSTPIAERELLEGHRVQLGLYARAVGQLLGRRVVSGFYWHIRSSKPSSLALERFEGGAEGAARLSLERAWEAVTGARAGVFAPDPEEGGCPDYCPGAAFCWHYRARERFA